jgi:hypothetical protein
MRQLQVEGAAVSGLHIGRKLVGSWTLDVKAGAKKCVPSGPGAQSFKSTPIDPAARGTLILVWALQS